MMTFFTVAEIARLAGVTTTAVRGWSMPEPVAKTREGRLLWDPKQVEAFLEERRQEAARRLPRRIALGKS